MMRAQRQKKNDRNGNADQPKQDRTHATSSQLVCAAQFPWAPLVPAASLEPAARTSRRCLPLLPYRSAADTDPVMMVPPHHAVTMPAVMMPVAPAAMHVSVMVAVSIPVMHVAMVAVPVAHVMPIAVAVVGAVPLLRCHCIVLILGACCRYGDGRGCQHG